MAGPPVRIRVVRGRFSLASSAREVGSSVIGEVAGHAGRVRRRFDLRIVLGGVAMTLIGIFFWHGTLRAGTGLLGAGLGGALMLVPMVLLIPLAIALNLLLEAIRGNREVDAREHDLSPTDVEDGLRRGTLSPHDLVFEGGGWSTLLESGAFGEAAAPLEARACRKRNAAIATLTVLGMALVAWLIVLATRIPAWLMSTD